MSTQKAFLQALSDRLSQNTQHNLTPAQAKPITTAYAQALLDCITAHGTAVLPGIGKLQVQAVPERMARNPLTGAKLKVPAKKRLKFTATAALKEAL